MNISPVILLSLFLLSLPSLMAEPATAERPNVILILADDMGPGMLSRNGQQIVTTPHIDKLASEGMYLSNHYGNTYCAPARWSLLTGMHNGRKGSGSQMAGGKIVPLDKQRLSPAEWQAAFQKIINHARPIPKQEVFLAQVAQKAGYHTAEFGKLDIGFLTSNERLRRHGWDDHFGYYDHERAHGYFPPYLWHNGEKVPLPGNTDIDCGVMSERGREPVSSGGKTYSQDVFEQKILSYIREHRAERFFLYHPTQLPHGPVAVTAIAPEFADRSDLTLSEKKYATMVKSLDTTVGKIMHELKTLGLDDRTVVFFSSDNGHETYYENAKGQLPKNVWRSGKLADGSMANLTDHKWRGSNGGDTFNGNGDRAGLKWSAWQGGILTAMIARWPGKIQPGGTSDLLTAHYDFMATLADIVGVDAPQNKDSISYLPTLLGQKQVKRHDWIFVQNSGPRSLSTLVSKSGYKLIQLKDNSFQLYHILDDLGERSEISKDHPEVVDRLIPIFKEQINSDRPDLMSPSK